MANPTTNYGFVLPTSTDLVTDLPADFDVALQGVDTRLKALQPGTTLGDIAYSSATANTNTRLGIGTSGQVLAVSGGGVPAWTTTADVTPLTTKGDLFTFTTVDARLGVGTNGQVLQADSAESTGLKWATPAAATSGMNVVKARTTFTNVANTGTTFDSVFTSTYADYLVIIDNWLGANSGDDPQMQLLYSGTTQASGYYGSSLGQTFDLASTTKGNTNTAEFTFWTSLGTNGGSNLALYFTRVGDGSNTAAWNGTGFGGGGDTYMTAGVATTSRTYTGLILKSSSGNISGAVTVYGLAKA